MYLKRNDGYTSSAYNLYENDNNVKLYVGGSKKADFNTAIDTRNCVTVLLASWTGNVSHNSNGKLTLNISGSFSMSGTSLSGGSVSCDFTCTDIPRASSFSLSSSSVNPGGSITVTISSSSNDFSHKVNFSIGTYSQTVTAEKRISSVSFTVPVSWANAVKNSVKGSISVKVTTYNGSSSVGSKTGSFSLKIPDTSDYRPQFTLTTQPVSDTVPDEWNCYVKGKSKVKVTLSGISYKYSATYSTLKVTVSGVTKSKNVTEFELNNSGDTEITVVLTDSRGLKKTVTQTISVIDYSPPSAVITDVFRCDANGVKNSGGSYLSVGFSCNFSDIDENNILTKSLKYKRAGSEVYTTVVCTASPAVIGGSILQSSSYDVKLCLSDLLTEEPVECVRRISSTDIPFNIKSGGKGAAFGCFSETDNELTVAYNLNVKGNLLSENITSKAVTNETFIDNMSGRIIKHNSLGMTFLNFRLLVKTEIASGSVITLLTLDGERPVYSAPLNVFSSGRFTDILCYINPSGEFILKANDTIEEGSYIYVNGVFINY